MGTAVEDEDLAPAPGAAIAAPAAEDHDLDFLKPGYRRPKAEEDDLAPAPGAAVTAPLAGPEDRIGRAARGFSENAAALASPQGGDKVAPYGVSGLVAGQQQKDQPQVSTGEAIGRGALQGASLGIGDEFAALADTAISKIPGVRRGAEYLADKAGGRGASLDYTNPDITYDERRDAYRNLNAAAREQHPKAYTAGQIAGGLATAAIPGTTLAKGAGALEAGLQGAALGGIAGAGESDKTGVGGVAGDALQGAALGGVGGAALHTIGSRVLAPLAEKAIAKIGGKTAAIADQQARDQLARGVPQSLTNPMTEDPNLRAALNEPIQIGANKTATLREISGAPAEKVRPAIQARQAEVDAKIANLREQSGNPTLSGLANKYDSEIDKLPAGSGKAVRELQKGRQETLQQWGPTDADRQAKLNELGTETKKIYAGGDQKSGGVTMGDFVKRYNDEIANLKTQPGNEPYVASLEHARDSAVKSWGTRPMFNPDAIVDGGSFEGAKAGDAVAKLKKMAANAPSAADGLNAEAQRIQDAATKDGFDPTAKVPAQDVRAYASRLQKEGGPAISDPATAKRAKQFTGHVTKDFVNGHVEDVMGPGDRKALEGLNSRINAVKRWPDVLSGKEKDPAIRDMVLNEFGGQKISPHELDAYASKLEEEGKDGIAKLTPTETMKAKALKGSVTRDFFNQHVSDNLSSADAGELQKQMALRSSLKNIDDVVARRAGQENAGKKGTAHLVAHLAGAAPGIAEVGHGVYKIATGNVGEGLAHLGAGAVAAAVPHAIENARAIGRAGVRGISRGADFLSNVVARAAEGNPWARRMVETMRQSPGGAARIAAAMTASRAPVGMAEPVEATAPESTGPAMAAR